MKTMFKVEEKVYTDCEGRNVKWIASDYIATVEEAEAKASEVSNQFPHTGSYRIIATTMDEATFTIKDETIKDFDYWREVKRVEEAKKWIAIYTEKIAELEASKTRCKTEKGIAKREKEIAEYRKMIAKENEWI